MKKCRDSHLHKVILKPGKVFPKPYNVILILHCVIPKPQSVILNPRKI